LNVSLGSAVAPAGAWPAELVGVAQPAMRRARGRTPPGPAPGSRSRHAAGQRCTTRRGNAHRTEISGEREVLYRWHPWAGCIVRVHEAVEKVDGTVLRCSRGGGATERWLELPAWMFDRAACLAMRTAPKPRVEFAALAVLQELLSDAIAHSDPSLSSNTPVLSPAGEARNQNRGKDDATANPISCEGSQTSPAARLVRRTSADERQLAGSDVAGAAGRDAAGADGINVATPARPRPRKTSSAPRGGGR